MKKFILMALCLSFTAFAKQPPPPKLILQITIDQFSGNQLQRFKSHIDKGGFAYLIKHGIWYDNAHQYHATTETAVGHTTLATGTVPAVHGIIANNWWDREQQKMVYAMDDPHYGVSPQHILVPSFSDALSIASRGQSKRFAVSTKDRGAIPLAGKMGKAFWLDRNTGHYTSTQYYYEKLPEWAMSWNQQHKSRQYLHQTWTLKKRCLDYLFCRDQQKHLETDLTSFHKQFPHPYGDHFNDTYLTHLTKSPASDELTLDFAKRLVTAEHLGKHNATDYLSISLSATDAVGHTFGPYSLESEDNFVRLNDNLGNFFHYIDKQVGLDKVLIVLSADHGAGPSPTYLANQYYPTFEIDEQRLLSNKAVQAVLKDHHLKAKQLISNASPNLYLNDAYLKAHHINKAKITQALAKAIATEKGIYAVIQPALVKKGLYSHPYLLPLLQNVIDSNRTGDLYLIAEPHIYLSDSHYHKANHGSPWRYDTHVPLLFVRSQYKPKRVHRFVKTIDLAPSLAAILDIDPPSASSGNILQEVTE